MLVLAGIIFFTGGAVFRICAGSSAANTGMFQLLLSRAHTASRHFVSHPTPAASKPGVHKKLEGTQLGQLTPAVQRDSP